MSSLLLFTRVYKQEIQTVMLVFLTGFVNYCPSNLNKYESISVNKYWSIDLYTCTVGYNKFDFFLENKEYRPFDGCKIEI
jgi:hypothetical protein